MASRGWRIAPLAAASARRAQPQETRIHQLYEGARPVAVLVLGAVLHAPSQ